MNEDIIKLIKCKENVIVDILKLTGYVELIVNQDGNKFDNLKLTDSGKLFLNKGVYFDDNWLKKVRLKWPSSLRSSNSTTRIRIENFINKTGASLEQIENLIDRWLNERKEPYCGKMENFFYKIDDNGEGFSQIESMYETYEEDKDYRNEQV